MGVLDSLAVGAAEHIERSFGPYAGLRAYVALLPSGPLTGAEDASLATRATLGALRCALEANDTAALESAARAWAFCVGPTRTSEVARFVARLERGARAAALLLAQSEATRAPSARAWYLVGRTAEGAERFDLATRAYEAASAGGAPRPWPAESFGSAGGAPPGAQPVNTGGDIASLRARARLVALLAGRRDPEARAKLGELLALPREDTHASPEEQLLFATLDLYAPSKFARAAALSRLEELARAALDPDPVIRARARSAIRTAARHADARGVWLTALEADRVAACLKHWPAKEPRERAISLLLGLVRLAAAKGADRERALVEVAMRDEASAPAAEQASSVLAGARFVAEGLESPHALGLRAIVALDRDRPDLAAEALALAKGGEAPPADPKDSAGQGLATPPALWTAALLGLRRPETAPAALALSRELLASDTPPPRGWVSLAAALSASPLEAARELSTEALERAGAAGEASVTPALTARWVRKAWALAGAGAAKRGEAIALLRKAAKRAS